MTAHLSELGHPVFLDMRSVYLWCFDGRLLVRMGILHHLMRVVLVARGFGRLSFGM